MNDDTCLLCGTQFARDTRHCAVPSCPAGALCLGRERGDETAASVVAFRLARRSARAANRLRFDDDEAQDICAEAARLADADFGTDDDDSIRHNRMMAVIWSAAGDEQRFANAWDWYGLASAYPILPYPADASLVEMLWFARAFGTALPCPLGLAIETCGPACPACDGFGELVEDCLHCVPYITVLDPMHSDGGWLRTRDGKHRWVTADVGAERPASTIASEAR